MSLSAAGVYIEFVTNANKLTIKVKRVIHETCFNWFEKYGFTNNIKDVIEAKTIKNMVENLAFVKALI